MPIFPEKYSFSGHGWDKVDAVDADAIRGSQLWQMMRDETNGGRKRLQEQLASCVADFKACADPEGAASVLRLEDVLPHGGASLFFGETDTPDLYLRGEVLKTLAYTSAVLDRLVDTMATRNLKSAGNMTTKCHESPVNDFLKHFPDPELPLLKEHLDNYAKELQKCQEAIFHTFFHGSPGSGKSMFLNWNAIFAGINGNPVFCYDQLSKTLTVYHPDGSIASATFITEDVTTLNVVIEDMFDSQKWDKTPIVLWDPSQSVDALVPDYTRWGPSFMATSNRAFLENDKREKPGSEIIALFHNILPWSEQEMVNLFSLTHSRSDVSRMYYYTGGSMRMFSEYLPTLPQYTAEMEHRLQDLKAMTTVAGCGGTATTVFLKAVEELEKLLVDLHLMDADAKAVKADLELLRHYVSQDATAVPSSAYEVVTELMERVWHWLRQQRSKADADGAELDAELDAAGIGADEAADAKAVSDHEIETRIRDIVEKVVGTMSVGELEMRSGAWNKGLGVMINVLND
jgi:hypothetical protein